MYNLIHFGKEILEKFQLQLYQLTFNFLNLIYVKKIRKSNTTKPNLVDSGKMSLYKIQTSKPTEKHNVEA